MANDVTCIECNGTIRWACRCHLIIGTANFRTCYNGIIAIHRISIDTVDDAVAAARTIATHGAGLIEQRYVVAARVAVAVRIVAIVRIMMGIVAVAVAHINAIWRRFCRLLHKHIRRIVIIFSRTEYIIVVVWH